MISHEKFDQRLEKKYTNWIFHWEMHYTRNDFLSKVWLVPGNMLH